MSKWFPWKLSLGWARSRLRLVHRVGLVEILDIRISRLWQIIWNKGGSGVWWWMGEGGWSWGSLGTCVKGVLHDTHVSHVASSFHIAHTDS